MKPSFWFGVQRSLEALEPGKVMLYPRGEVPHPMKEGALVEDMRIFCNESDWVFEGAEDTPAMLVEPVRDSDGLLWWRVSLCEAERV